MAEAKGQIFPMDQHRFSYNECSRYGWNGTGRNGLLQPHRELGCAVQKAQFGRHGRPHAGCGRHHQSPPPSESSTFSWFFC